MVDAYFSDGQMPLRQVLFWAVAARRQLDRWEPMVAQSLWSTYPQGDAVSIGFQWEAETEHHFTILAMDHMFEAIKLWGRPVSLASVVREEIAEVRDLVTHWRENMPVFNVRPRTQEAPRYTGKRFARRNPGITPYDPLAWNSRRGALLTRNVSASDARGAVLAAQEAVLADAPDLARFVPAASQASPWLVDEHGNWWPAQTKEM